MTDLEQKALGLVNAQFREPWYKTWQDVPQGVFARAVLHAAKSIEEMKIVVRTLLTDSQHTIEALEAENERLSYNGIHTCSDECQRLPCVQRREIDRLKGEVERLRRVLARWQYSGCPNCSGDCGSANPPVMCCIMEETRAALGEKQ